MLIGLQTSSSWQAWSSSNKVQTCADDKRGTSSKGINERQEPPTQYRYNPGKPRRSQTDFDISFGHYEKDYTDIDIVIDREREKWISFS